MERGKMCRRVGKDEKKGEERERRRRGQERGGLREGREMSRQR